MESITRRITYASRSDEWRIYLLADTHLGSRHTDEHALRRVIAMIAQDEQALWVHLGDVCEYIGRGDRRHDEEEYASWLWGKQDIAKAQRDYAAEMFAPIGGKLVALCEGNHEAAIYQHQDTEVYKELATRLTSERVTLGHRGLARVLFTRGDDRRNGWSLMLYLSHGSGGGQSDGALPTRMARIAQSVEGVDVVAIGHYHKDYLKRVVRLRPQRNGLEQHTLNYMAVPSFVTGAEYAERADMAPAMLGYGLLRITPDRQEIRASIEGA
jgi:predicted phosphodiesterase